MANEGLGKIAGRWLKAKTDELLTTDNRQRENAAYSAEIAERDAQAKAAEEAIFAAAPGLREFKENQEAAQSAREMQRLQDIDDELRARPLAGIGLKLDGNPSGEFSGHLPTTVEVLPPGERSTDPDDDWVDPDPYFDHQTLKVDIGAFPEQRPMFDDMAFGGWTFFVPGYQGDGTYDLVDIHRRREAADAYPEYLDWTMYFDDGGDCDLFFYPDAGPTTVTVANGGTSIQVVMTTGSAMGETTISANILLSAPPAGA